MVSEREMFEVFGPTTLSPVDWYRSYFLFFDSRFLSKSFSKNRNFFDHRRSIAACLVQATYILEADREEKREGDQALAPPWWKFFNFRLRQLLIDDADNSIFGAIYEHPQNSSNIPRFVIAFRGTITKGDAVSRDIQLDVNYLQNCLHRSTRTEIATRAVKNMVSSAGTSNIWLTGHSLGSAIAMVVGKKIKLEMGVLLESFLFNPPFMSAPIERIKDKNVKHGIRIAASVITAGLAIANQARQPQLQHQARSDDSFNSLSAWMPHLFVNPHDDICSEYIGYFEHRKKMEDIGVGSIEKLATQHSLGGLLRSALGKGTVSEPPVHLLPSANLIVNRSHTPDFKFAHGIHQWWIPNLDLQHKKYRYAS